MEAIVQDEYGSPDVLELQEVDKPVVKDDEVLVRVHATGVNPADPFMMRGSPYFPRRPAHRSATHTSKSRHHQATSVRPSQGCVCRARWPPTRSPVGGVSGVAYGVAAMRSLSRWRPSAMPPIPLRICLSV